LQAILSPLEQHAADAHMLGEDLAEMLSPQRIERRFEDIFSYKVDTLPNSFLNMSISDPETSGISSPDPPAKRRPNLTSNNLILSQQVLVSDSEMGIVATTVPSEHSHLLDGHLVRTLL
jgi:hypothetical protein